MTNAINALVLAAGNAVGSLVDNSSSYEELFPILQQGSGAPGFDARGNADLDELNARPKITGYYMAHRFNFVAYPDRPKTDEHGKVIGEVKKPVYGGAAPYLGADCTLVKNAAQATQFMPRDRKSELDFIDGSAKPSGHVRTSIEILAFVPAVNRVVVLRSYNHYCGIFQNSSKDKIDCTMATLEALQDENGQIKQTPILFQGMTKPGVGAAKIQWVSATYDASSLKKCQEALDAFLAQQYKDLLPDLNKWAKCEDNPITDTVRGYLNNVVALNPPRR